MRRSLMVAGLLWCAACVPVDQAVRQLDTEIVTRRADLANWATLTERQRIESFQQGIVACTQVRFALTGQAEPDLGPVAPVGSR